MTDAFYYLAMYIVAIFFTGYVFYFGLGKRLAARTNLFMNIGITWFVGSFISMAVLHIVAAFNALSSVSTYFHTYLLGVS